MQSFFIVSYRRAAVISLLLGGLFAAAGCSDVITYSKESRDKGLEYYAKGNYDDAAGAFKNAIRQNPADYRSHYYLAACYAQDHDFYQAIEQYKACLAIMPTSMNGQLDRPFRLKALDGLAAAVAGVGDRTAQVDALPAECKTAEDYFLVAKVNRNLGDADAAIESYHQATLVDPNDFDIAKEFALYLVKLNQIQQADPQLRHAYALNSNDDDVNAALRQIGVVPGPALKPASDLAKPIIPEGPIPSVDVSKIRLQNPFTSDNSSATSAAADQGPRD
jgi:tetratricopeptide (TPR) repeat protein